MMPLPGRLAPLAPVLILVAAIWAVELVQQLTGHALNRWIGLEPRTLGGLAGIPAMPFLHAGIGHVAANTPPLLILGALGLWVAPRRFLGASLAIVLVSGLAVWLLARGNSVHVGASGLVFGWAAFLVAHGVLVRSLAALVGAAAVILVYGSMFLGLLPGWGSTVSWEAHIAGALAGAGAAWWGRPRRAAT